MKIRNSCAGAQIEVLLRRITPVPSSFRQSANRATHGDGEGYADDATASQCDR
jgi:hypothetical protein